VYDTKTDKDMILSPVSWPRWPVLPLKRGDVFSNGGTGFLIASREPWSAVYLTNMYELKAGPIRPQLENVEKITYSSIDALIDDGWVVD